jgi:hypothetical protein
VILIPKWYLGQLSTWHSFTTWNMCHKYVHENKLPCICSFFHKGIIMVSMKRSYLIHMLIAWHIYHSIFKLVDGTSSAHSFNPYVYFDHSWSYIDIQILWLRILYLFPWKMLWYICHAITFLIYYMFYLYISFHAYTSTCNDTKGFSWKDLPSWKCEIL